MTSGLQKSQKKNNWNALKRKKKKTKQTEIPKGVTPLLRILTYSSLFISFFRFAPFLVSQFSVLPWPQWINTHCCCIVALNFALMFFSHSLCFSALFASLIRNVDRYKYLCSNLAFECNSFHKWLKRPDMIGSPCLAQRTQIVKNFCSQYFTKLKIFLQPHKIMWFFFFFFK